MFSIRPEQGYKKESIFPKLWRTIKNKILYNNKINKEIVFLFLF